MTSIITDIISIFVIPIIWLFRTFKSYIFCKVFASFNINKIATLNCNQLGRYQFEGKETDS